jgi:CrcB protein
MALVAIGGVIGSLFRYLLSELLGSDQYGILAANVIGVVVAGFAVVYCANHANQNLRHFLLPGFCGGLTTFSSAMLLTHSVGLIYLVETVVLSAVVIAVTIPIARKIFENQL